MEAATPALSDSREDDIGIETSRSQVSLTRRPRPSPSEPDHHDQRTGGEVGVGEQVGQREVAGGGQADDLAAGVLEVLEGAHQVGRVGDRDAGRRRRPTSSRPRRSSGRHGARG